MAAYPSLLISFPFTEDAPDYQVIRSEMEAGYVQTRAKTTVAPRIYTFKHRALSAANVATWLAFWNARKGGAEAFDFTDPRTSATVSCRFRQSAPRITRTGPITYDLDVEIEELL